MRSSRGLRSFRTLLRHLIRKLIKDTAERKWNNKITTNTIVKKMKMTIQNGI